MKGPAIRRSNLDQFCGKPWLDDRACECGGAGAPCPICNHSNENTPQELPEGFEAIMIQDDEQD